MPIFLVIPLISDPKPLADSVLENIPNEADRHQLQNGQAWLIHFSGTTVELSNQLKITAPEKGGPLLVGPAMVTLVGAYYGIASMHTWEWIQTRVDK